MNTSPRAENPSALPSILSSLEQKFPVGNRAQEASRLYLAGEVQPLPRSRTLGDDRWKVCGYTVSISGKYCTCADAEDAPKHNGGPLCAHRIAAMLRQRLGDPAGENGPGIFSPATDAVVRLSAVFAEAQAGGIEQVRLKVRVALTWNRGTDQGNTCEGYLLYGDGRTWNALETSRERAAMLNASAAFNFTMSELSQAIDAHGWQYLSKNRAPGGGRCASLRDRRSHCRNLVFRPSAGARPEIQPGHSHPDRCRRRVKPGGGDHRALLGDACSTTKQEALPV